MKSFHRLVILLLILMPAQPSLSAACTVCHSKNPKMVRMHEALEYKDCFKCHGPMSERKTPQAKDETVKEVLCVACHKSEPPTKK